MAACLCLQARLADSNRNLAAKVLILLGDIARAMGPPFDARARTALLFPAVANLSDNKKQVGGGVGGWVGGCIGWVGTGRLVTSQLLAGVGLAH